MISEKRLKDLRESSYRTMTLTCVTLTRSELSYLMTVHDAAKTACDTSRSEKTAKDDLIRLHKALDG